MPTPQTIGLPKISFLLDFLWDGQLARARSCLVNCAWVGLLAIALGACGQGNRASAPTVGNPANPQSSQPANPSTSPATTIAPLAADERRALQTLTALVRLQQSLWVERSRFSDRLEPLMSELGLRPDPSSYQFRVATAPAGQSLVLAQSQPGGRSFAGLVWASVQSDRREAQTQAIFCVSEAGAGVPQPAIDPQSQRATCGPAARSIPSLR